MKKVSTFIMALVFMYSTGFAYTPEKQNGSTPEGCHELAEALATLAEITHGYDRNGEGYLIFLRIYDQCMDAIK